MNDWSLKHRFAIDCYMDVTDSSPIAMCYDCLCLVYLLRTMRSLFYNIEMKRWNGLDIVRPMAVP